MNIENNIDEFVDQWYRELRAIKITSETEDEIWYNLQSILSRIVDTDICIRLEDKLNDYEY